MTILDQRLAAAGGAGLSHRDRGSSTVELVLLTPIVIVVLLFLVGLGRYAYGRQLVQQAATAAARSASLASAADAAGRARTAGQASLDSAGLACQSFDVAVEAADFTAGGTVTVTVWCTVNNSDSVMAGLPGRSTVTASSSVPLETYRQIGTAGR